MNIRQQLAIGFRSYFRAVKYIHQNKLYWIFPIPALLMLFVYFLGIKLAHWTATFDSKVTCLGCQSMNDTIWFLLKIFFSLILGLTLMKFAKYIVVILLSPLFSMISRQIEKKLTGNHYKFSLDQTMKDTKRGILIAFRNMFWWYLYTGIILFIAYLGWNDIYRSPIFYLIFPIAFYYYGFSFIDYINERRRLDIQQSVHFMRKYKGLAISIGSIYTLFIFLPVNIGKMIDFSQFFSDPFDTSVTILIHLVMWGLASIAPVLAIVSATLAMHELIDLKSNQTSFES